MSETVSHDHAGVSVLQTFILIVGENMQLTQEDNGAV